MDAGFARFGISHDEHSDLARFVERISSESTADPDVQADLAGEMWLKCLTLLDKPPSTMPADGFPRTKYLMTSMARAAKRFKPFDSPVAHNHIVQNDRMTEYTETDEE
jgi:hypothetical protein